MGLAQKLICLRREYFQKKEYGAPSPSFFSKYSNPALTTGADL
jgi:hypothetical protein